MVTGDWTEHTRSRLFREATKWRARGAAAQPSWGRSKCDHLVKGHHILLTGGAPRVSPGSPAGIPWCGAHPVTSSTHRRNRAGLARNSGPTFCSKSQGRAGARAVYKVQEQAWESFFSKRGPCTPAGPPIQRKKKAEHIP